jgi:hypothetical protein
MRKVPKSAKAISAHSVLSVADSGTLANLWQATLSEGPGEVLWLVELRGFEPLTSCMPWTAWCLARSKSTAFAQVRGQIEGP